MDAQTTNANTMTTQPQSATEMSMYFSDNADIFFLTQYDPADVINASAAPNGSQAHCEHKHKASRLRGGGMGKVIIFNHRHMKPFC